jgi:hypothetical protein
MSVQETAPPPTTPIEGATYLPQAASKPPTMVTIQIEETYRDAIVFAHRLIKELRGKEVETYVKMLSHFDEMKEAFLLRVAVEYSFSEKEAEEYRISMLNIRYFLELPFYQAPRED